ncbi:zinc-ribbon-domain-containing protein [Radiomyces spectabilis]|uniref:zinc-ribbon-domain-containing protein n=1 Tax=Radiomyces spectabilis TaxID=64574 RepID=UPI00221F7D74|nr:zinc-ribbon-domain-containing protein [Radiomyces spectabilis]KAI8388418.1 zinc-ribbon-domain-containing protein [Radiomyces spectabilis]
MSSSFPEQLDTDSDDLDYDHEMNALEDDEEDWWDAEEETAQTSQASNVEDVNTSNTTEQRTNGTCEAELRKKILEIQKDSSLAPREKARQMQYLLSHGTLPPTSVDGSPNSSTRQAFSDDKSRSVSFNNKDEGILGCKHYQRKVKLQANCCGRIFSCRFCHDDNSDHAIVRTETKNMFCMLCMTLQPAGQVCPNCNEQVARYYCDKCKLWDDDPKKSIYHCDECGICRQGRGLGDDYFHCKKCNICMTITMKNKHRCIERNLESDCPICGEYMFTSTTTVIFMPCGHCIHRLCYTAHIENSYQCPTCLKSLSDMSAYFARLDRELERQPMPPGFEKIVSHIFCNDCEKKSAARYHYVYHKCGHCGSYNTTVLRTENTAESATNRTQDEDDNENKPSTAPVPESSTDPLRLPSRSEQERLLPSTSEESNHTRSIDRFSSLELPPSRSSQGARREDADFNDG